MAVERIMTFFTSPHFLNLFVNKPTNHHTWETLLYIAGYEKLPLNNCVWQVTLYFSSCKQPANRCWLFDIMITCQRVQVNGHFSDRVAHLSATCTPPQVYGHFSDFCLSVKIFLYTTCQPQQVVGRFSDP